MIPKVVIIDPELTLSAPKSIIASSGIDLLSHVLESYYSINNNQISYPLPSKYNIPHEEVYGLTQDKVLLLNLGVEFDKIDKLSKFVGYKNVEEFAGGIYQLKEKIGLANKLRYYNIKENYLEKISSLCTSPNILANPYKFDKDKILDLLQSIY